MAKRTAIVLFKDNILLIGHSPNKMNVDNTWDLPKGHCEEGESYEDCGWRELFEETGYKKSDLNISNITFSEEFKYIKDTMIVMFVELNKLPKKKPKCTSFFELKNGKKLPEFSTFMWVHFTNLKEYLYYSHVNSTIEIIEKHLNKNIS